jgi:hypothetical protein
MIYKFIVAARCSIRTFAGVSLFAQVSENLDVLWRVELGYIVGYTPDSLTGVACRCNWRVPTRKTADKFRRWF